MAGDDIPADRRIELVALFLAVLAVTMTAAGMLLLRYAAPIVTALRGGLPLDGPAWRRLFLVPARSALVSAGFWCAAAVLFAVHSATRLGNALAEALALSVVLVLAGLTAAAANYLLVDRGLRPLYAAAFASRMPGAGGRRGGTAPGARVDPGERGAAHDHGCARRLAWRDRCRAAPTGLAALGRGGRHDRRDPHRGGRPALDAGIGVSSGEVVAGDVGSEHRFEYTVIGDPVNEAARLTELAKARSGRLLASGATVTRADDTECRHWTHVGSEQLRGRLAPTELWERSPQG